jgi:hypothetical protein
VATGQKPRANQEERLPSSAAVPGIKCQAFEYLAHLNVIDRCGRSTILIVTQNPESIMPATFTEERPCGSPSSGEVNVDSK